MTIFDEIAQWGKQFHPAGFVEEKPPMKSKVRVTFNRDFTWAEREDFRKMVEFVFDNHHYGFKSDEPSVLFIETSSDSRETVEAIQEYVAQRYLNIFPTAVKTIYPETRV
jgi:hypothetical protein